MNALQRALGRLGSEEARFAALVAVIVLLVTVALVTVVRSSWDALPRPEIIVETCSFLAALLIVLAQQGAERRARRNRAIENLLLELSDNASELTSGELMRNSRQLMVATADHEDGLRYYYSHLSTTATQGAVLSGALSGRQDRELAERLSRWVHECEACNRRFTMSELRLFSTAGDEEGVRERARIHVSIVTGPARHQREALKEISAFLVGFCDSGCLPKRLKPLIDQLATAVKHFQKADRIVAEFQQAQIQQQLGLVES